MSQAFRHILLVYPEFGPTYWGMKYTLPLVGKKATLPPLGLITIAALTPPGYEFRLVDLTCEPLTECDLEWADMVCFSAMISQKPTLFHAAEVCKAAGKLVVMGGPYPTACPDECRPHCDVLVLNEAEITWPLFLSDLAEGTYKDVYASAEKPDVRQTPVPRFDLLNLDHYAAIPIQFSRGCPFSCEFCDIIVMFGRKPRTKTPEQILAELSAVYDTGYRGSIFIVDDNFIGNKAAAKELLFELRAWNAAHRYPFVYATEASVDLARDQGLVRLMVEANFSGVFLGIETPSMESLRETRKFQNLKTSLTDSVAALQDAGLMVQGGFIIGFDNDDEDIFDRQIAFIREAAIPFAMVGMLVALPGTPLFKRLEQTGRLIADEVSLGEGVDQCGFTNVVTVLPRRKLLEGYRSVLETIYSPEEFYARCLETLRRLPAARPRIGWAKRSDFSIAARLKIVARSIRALPRDYRRESLRFLWGTLKSRPSQLFYALGFVVMGIHFYRFTFEHVRGRLTERLASLPPEDGERRANAASVA
jgi:radical SAM superfamily enzyme YgiQ (UPF0313 family)